MNIERLDIVEVSIVEFVKQVREHTLDGWDISPTCPGDVVGYGYGTYTVSLYRDESTVEKLKYAAGRVQDAPKLSVDDRMAKARQARAAKAKLDVDTVQGDE